MTKTEFIQLFQPIKQNKAFKQAWKDIINYLCNAGQLPDNAKEWKCPIK